MLDSTTAEDDDGGALSSERTPALALHLGAFCNATPCNLPPGYAEGIALVVDSTFAPVSQASVASLATALERLTCRMAASLPGVKMLS